MAKMVTIRATGQRIPAGLLKRRLPWVVAVDPGISKLALRKIREYLGFFGDVSNLYRRHSRAPHEFAFQRTTYAEAFREARDMQKVAGVKFRFGVVPMFPLD